MTSMKATIPYESLIRRSSWPGICCFFCFESDKLWMTDIISPDFWHYSLSPLPMTNLQLASLTHYTQWRHKAIAASQGCQKVSCSKSRAKWNICCTMWSRPEPTASGHEGQSTTLDLSEAGTTMEEECSFRGQNKQHKQKMYFGLRNFRHNEDRR